MTNGLFTTLVDFGPNAFTGTSNWLQIAVRTNGNGGFSTLTPRQQLTPAPYALNALFANSAGNLASGLTIQQNADGAPDVIEGSSVNFVASGVEGATISGGGTTNYFGLGPVANSVTANFGTVGGGAENTASGIYATVVGGFGNFASGMYATVCGGDNNIASGDYSFAAGRTTLALQPGTFVWADSQAASYSSDRANQFKIRAGGGVQMDVSGSSGLNPAAVTINSTSGNGIGLVVNQNSSDTSALFANNGTGDIIKGFSGGGNTVFEVFNDGTVQSKNMTLTSDRNVKENFKPLDAQTILGKVTALPFTEWNYKTNGVEQKHIGPMAQDFHAAFGLNGEDDKHISVVDEGGVAPVAIQGLNQKLEEIRAENAELKQRLAALEKIVLTQKSN